MEQLFLAFIMMNFCSAPTVGGRSAAASSRKEVSVCYSQMKECVGRNQKNMAWQDSIVFCMDQIAKGDR